MIYHCRSGIIGSRRPQTSPQRSYRSNYKQVRPLHRGHSMLLWMLLRTARESTKWQSACRCCKGKDRKEPSGWGLLYLAQFMSGSEDGEPRRFLTGVPHIRGTQCRKGRRTNEGRQLRAAGQEEQGRLSQRRQKPRWNNVKTQTTKHQLHSLQTSDPQSLEVQSDFLASSPLFFWHCSPLEQSVSCVYETEMNAPMDTFLEMCHHSDIFGFQS